MEFRHGSHLWDCIDDICIQATLSAFLLDYLHCVLQKSKKASQEMDRNENNDHCNKPLVFFLVLVRSEAGSQSRQPQTECKSAQLTEYPWIQENSRSTQDLSNKRIDLTLDNSSLFAFAKGCCEVSSN